MRCMITGSDRRTFYGDALGAIALAALLALAYSARNWHQLTALRLPDTDDVMRLQQIRDWLAGQSFFDLSQHRLAGGLPMHWSRLPDLVPAGLILALAPTLGRHAAELVAVIAWPTILFAAALLLAARLTRWLAPEMGGVAVILMAVAFPATTMFVPGRIDHHNFQIVLLLATALALVRPASWQSGAIAGTATVASVAIGLETLPLLVAAGVWLTIEWIRTQPGADARMQGFAASLVAGLFVAGIALRPDQWAYPACDAFTAIFFRVALAAAGAAATLALSSRLAAAPSRRAQIAIASGSIATLSAVLAAPQCLSPYGNIDPLLAHLWLSRVGEAQPLVGAPLTLAIGEAGLMLTGIVATCWQCHQSRDTRWSALLTLQVAALGVTLLQMRGVNLGAPLAVPALAATIGAARRRGTIWALAVWPLAAGSVYPFAAQAIPLVLGTSEAPFKASRSCTTPEALAAIAALPPGTIMAPLDPGPYILAASAHRVIAAPYHRNNAGNRASYDFFLGSPMAAWAVAHRWHADYVLLCDDSLTELAPAEQPRDAMLTRLRERRPPAWLAPIEVRSAGVHIWRVR